MREVGRRLAVGLLLLVLSCSAMAAGVEVDDARLRLLPGDLPAAGYFSLNNSRGGPIALVGAESPAFEQVSIHRSMEKEGMTSMVPVPRLNLASGESVEFAPGGYHLMLMKRRSPTAIGDEVSVTLLFEDGLRLPVIFQAVSPASL